jgi:hypothetical protein
MAPNRLRSQDGHQATTRTTSVRLRVPSRSSSSLVEGQRPQTVAYVISVPQFGEILLKAVGCLMPLWRNRHIVDQQFTSSLRTTNQSQQPPLSRRTPPIGSARS